MSRHNLAIVFGPTLMEPQTDAESLTNLHYSHTSQEIGCVEDLLEYFDYLFDVSAQNHPYVEGSVSGFKF